MGGASGEDVSPLSLVLGGGDELERPIGPRLCRWHRRHVVRGAAQQKADDHKRDREEDGHLRVRARG